MNSRTIGRNIHLVMKDKGMDFCELAHRTGFSKEDIIRILSGALVLSNKDLSLVANALGTSRSELLNEYDNNMYKGLIHCMGTINNQDNVDQIIDYIDTYVMLEEDRELLKKD